MEKDNEYQIPKAIKIVSDGPLAYDCKIYDAEGINITDRLFPSAITINLRCNQLNQAIIETECVQLDLYAEGKVRFKIPRVFNREKISPEEEKEYKRQFLQTIQNLEVENIEFE